MSETKPVALGAMVKGVCVESTSAARNEITDQEPDFFRDFWSEDDEAVVVPLYTLEAARLVIADEIEAEAEETQPLAHLRRWKDVAAWLRKGGSGDE